MSLCRSHSCPDNSEIFTERHDVKYPHVLFIYGAQGRVIQAPEVGPIQIIKKDGIRDLLDRDTPNIFGGQDRKRYALNCRRDW
jgi:hypothetical protein